MLSLGTVLLLTHQMQCNQRRTLERFATGMVSIAAIMTKLWLLRTK